MNTTSRFYINGRFLTRRVTGVERYATEVLKQLDALVADDLDSRWTVLIPTGCATAIGFSHIDVEETGCSRGHLWEQTALPLRSRDGFLVSLCNSGPVFARRQLVVIHDAAVYRHPRHFSRPYRLLHQALGRLLARRFDIATVSPFSRRELVDILGLRRERVAVLANGGDHILDITPDSSVLARLDLKGRRFFLFVSSMAPHKNLATALAAFGLLADDQARFVVVGAANPAVFSDVYANAPPGVLWAGRLTDAEIVALYQKAVALVFPSLYEGFGIPLLEASMLGCPVLASDIAPARDLLGDCAHYFSPQDAPALAALMGDKLSESADEAAEEHRKTMANVEHYTWRATAEAMLAMVRTLARSPVST